VRLGKTKGRIHVGVSPVLDSSYSSLKDWRTRSTV
jgi:hypothetical protein